MLSKGGGEGKVTKRKAGPSGKRMCRELWGSWSPTFGGNLGQMTCYLQVCPHFVLSCLPCALSHAHPICVVCLLFTYKDTLYPAPPHLTMSILVCPHFFSHIVTCTSCLFSLLLINIVELGDVWGPQFDSDRCRIYCRHPIAPIRQLG